jgi:hypothetical protein
MKKKEKKDNSLFPQIPGLQSEVGVTETSLSNGRILTKEVGRPALVVLTKDGQEWLTTTYWGNHCNIPGFKFVFNGFSWGYGGTGPAGLATYLKELGVKGDIDSTTLARLKDTDLPKVFEI